MIVKGVTANICFGGYDDCVADLTPVELKKIERCGDILTACILYEYPDGRSIVLTENKLREVDYSSFGTSLESEIEKTGLKMEDVKEYPSGEFNIMYHRGYSQKFEIEVEFERCSRSYCPWGVSNDKMTYTQFADDIETVMKEWAEEQKNPTRLPAKKIKSFKVRHIGAR